VILLLATLGLCGTAAAMTPDEAVTAALAHDPALAASEARVEAGKGALSGASWLRHNPQINGRVPGGVALGRGAVGGSKCPSGAGLCGGGA